MKERNFNPTLLSDFFEAKFHHASLGNDITFFGGSFNPLHQGHLACIDLWFKKNKDHSQKSLIIIPDLSPWKKNELTSISHRENIIKNLKEKLPKQSLLFSDFLLAKDSNPTIDWISRIHNAFPEVKLSLLMGVDSFVNLDKWKSSKKLMQILSCLYVVSRNDDVKLINLKKKEYLIFNKYLIIKFLGHHDFEDLSSTKIREDIHSLS